MSTYSSDIESADGEEKQMQTSVQKIIEWIKSIDILDDLVDIVIPIIILIIIGLVISTVINILPIIWLIVIIINNAVYQSNISNFVETECYIYEWSETRDLSVFLSYYGEIDGFVIDENNNINNIIIQSPSVDWLVNPVLLHSTIIKFLSRFENGTKCYLNVNLGTATPDDTSKTGIIACIIIIICIYVISMCILFIKYLIEIHR